MGAKFNHIGQQKQAVNGQMMSIIRYENGGKSIDVQFEDGTIVKNKSYSSFYNGHIGNPNFNEIQKRAKMHIGETNIAYNGQKMTLIAYRGSTDIDVEFEDGMIVRHRTYSDFREGLIRNTRTLKTNEENLKLPQTRMNKYGDKLTLIHFRDYNHCDVMLNDKYLLRNKVYYYFEKGLLGNNITERKIGEINYNDNNEKMIIIAYRNSKDIDVCFPNTFNVVYNVSYYRFKKGNIKNISNEPKEPLHSRVGEIGVNNQGLKMMIINYLKEDDIDVIFETGVIVYQRAYNKFKSGQIAEKTKLVPIIPKNRKNGLDEPIKEKPKKKVNKKSVISSKVKRKPNFPSKEEDRINETRLNNKGEKMTIIAYRSNKDIDIIFDESDLVITHRAYKDFKAGKVTKPVNVIPLSLYNK